MDQSRYKQPKHRNSYGSTDGFVKPEPKTPVTYIPTLKTQQQIYPEPEVAQEPQITPPEQSITIPEEQVLQQPATASQLAQLIETNSFHGKNTFSNSVNRKDRKRPLLNRQVKSKSKKKLILKSAVLLLVLLLGIGGYLGLKGLSTVNKVFHGNILSDATAAFNETPLKGESDGRVNILLAGDSIDDPNHGGAQLTDSILLLSIDTKNHTAFLLSIPRDLWIYIPGMSSYQKINTANTVSNFNAPGYPSGGMGELEEVIQTQLGIPIDYYGLMDYGAFKDSVNAVGGVTITINSSDPRGLYDPNTNLKLPNGPVTLDGQQALNLARARGDGYGSYGFPNSDFDRTEHQRQLFLAVAAKAKTLGVLANPVKISNLLGAFGTNFQTDLSLQNVLRLIQITKGVNPSTIQSYAFSSTISSTMPNPILENYTDPSSGQEALIPSSGIGDFGSLEQYYQQLTSNNPVVKEDPSVVILNGSDVNGLASKERTTLQSDGFNVTAVADANNDYASTMVIDNVAATKPNSLKLLQKLFPGETATTDTTPPEATEAQGYTSDFVVVLGQNWQSNNTATSQ
jgi:LCP family protein required for cell wall assembly